jgi:hypothetical protein
MLYGGAGEAGHRRSARLVAAGQDGCVGHGAHDEGATYQVEPLVRRADEHATASHAASLRPW